MNTLLPEIRESINGLSDEDLLDLVTLNKSEYRQESLELAREAIIKRGLSIPSETKEYYLMEEEEEEQEERIPPDLRAFRILALAYLAILLAYRILISHNIFGDIFPFSLLFGEGRSVFWSFRDIFSLENASSIYDQLAFPASFIATIGLFYFRRWGRTLFLLCILGYWLIMANVPSGSSTGLVGLLGSIIGPLEGAILALAYLSPLRREFAKQPQKLEVS